MRQHYGFCETYHSGRSTALTLVSSLNSAQEGATTGTRDWKHTRALWIKTLENKTGRSLAYWNKRIAETNPLDKYSLQGWLKQEGITGYAAQVLVMERFGYPDFIKASGAKLIEAQYADRAKLRPIYDLIVAAAQGFGQVVVQARKGTSRFLARERHLHEFSQPRKRVSMSASYWRHRSPAAVFSPVKFTRRCRFKWRFHRRRTSTARLCSGFGGPTMKLRECKTL
jgi:hypothetical protein